MQPRPLAIPPDLDRLPSSTARRPRPVVGDWGTRRFRPVCPRVANGVSGALADLWFGYCHSPLSAII